MLINMHEDLKRNMENLVEKFSTNVPIVEANMQSTKSM
jgi:hypothetical protein